jgi:hypothetical protein
MFDVGHDNVASRLQDLLDLIERQAMLLAFLKVAFIPLEAVE